MGICIHPTETKHTVESGTYTLGVECYHLQGITSVEFKAEDGSNPAVTSTVTSVSSYTKHALAMHCPNSTLDLSSLDDGQVTITITATAGDGTTVASTSYVILNNSGGSFTPIAVYMDSAFEGDSDGSESAPYKNLVDAVKALSSAGGGDAGGHTVYVKAGEHGGSTINSGYPGTSRANLTIQAAPGLAASDVTFTSTQSLRGILHIHVKGVTIRRTQFDLNKLDSVYEPVYGWLEGCVISGPGTDKSNQNYRPIVTGDFSDEVAITECTLDEVANPFTGFGYVRGCTATNAGEDVFKNVRFAVNSVVSSHTRGDSSYHCDGSQFFGGAISNRLVKSCRIYNTSIDQLLLHDKTGTSYTDIWYVNCLFHINPTTSNAFSQWNLPHTNVVFLHSAIVGQRLGMRAENGFTASGVQWINSYFHDATASGSTIDTPAKFQARGCHYRSTPSPSQYLTGTVGDPLFKDPEKPNFDFRPKEGSPLIGAGVSFFDFSPGGDKGVGDPANPNIGPWGDVAGAGLSGSVYEDPVGVEPTEWLHKGVDLQALVSRVWDDPDVEEILEGIAFFSETPQYPSSKANWTTYYTIRVGIRKPESGNWTVSLFGSYGSPFDVNPGSGNGNKPYYSRVSIPVTLGATTIYLDQVSSAEVIGNGQGIPPTVVTWNPDTQTVVSTDFAGKDYAFTQSKRIESNPNDTGYADDGEFVIRYDHTTESEGRDVFMPIACWPCGWVAANGRFVRGDVPIDSSGGFCTAEGDPYARKASKGSKVYPITHFFDEPWKDKGAWDNSWVYIPRPDRVTSGISAFCGDIVSRHDAGDEILRNPETAWLLKKVAAMQLQQLPSPVKPHVSDSSLNNYDRDAMRAKGRVVSVLTWITRCLIRLCQVRDETLDPEAFELRDACSLRVAEIIALLKVDYDQNSWLHYDREGETAYAPFELGHYFQELLLVQEAIEELFQATDPKIEEMLATFASELHRVHVYWTNGGPHPYDPSVTYNGGKTGWYIPYFYFRNESDRFKSYPTDSSSLSSTTTIMAHQWSRVNGLNTGSKQDDIITQDEGIDYKWQLGSQARKLFTSLTGSASMDATVAPVVHHGTSLTGCLQMTARVSPTISGGGLARRGTPVAITSYSRGTPVRVSQVDA